MTAGEFHKWLNIRIAAMHKIRSRKAQIKRAKHLVKELAVLNELRKEEGIEPFTMPNMVKFSQQEV